MVYISCLFLRSIEISYIFCGSLGKYAQDTAYTSAGQAGSTLTHVGPSTGSIPYKVIVLLLSFTSTLSWPFLYLAVILLTLHLGPDISPGYMVGG